MCTTLNILGSLKRINAELDHFLPAGLIEQACRETGYHFRRRMLNPVLSVHLLVLQLLAQTALRPLRFIIDRPQLSRQAINQARSRLPLAALLHLVELLCRGLQKSAAAAVDHVMGLRLVLVDGTCSSTPDTLELSQRFGKGCNQRGPSPGCPIPKLLALMDYSTGLLHKIIALPWARQEKTCLHRMLRYLHPGDLVLADRGLVSFAHLALMLQQGVQACARLPACMIVRGRGNSTHQRVRSLGKQDLLVRWLRYRCPMWMSKPAFELLPKTLELRQIGFRLCRKGFRPQWLWIITTLTDPRRYPAETIIDLYQRRWQIEVYFRDLKTTLGMKRFSARTVEGVRKQLLAFVILYNLIRITMLRAAHRQQVPADRISFIDVADWLLWSVPGEAMPEFEVNPHRRRPTQPRALKHCRRRYPRLAHPRHKLERPPYEARL